jgi:hypothetical protein
MEGDYWRNCGGECTIDQKLVAVQGSPCAPNSHIAILILSDILSQIEVSMFTVYNTTAHLNCHLYRHVFCKYGYLSSSIITIIIHLSHYHRRYIISVTEKAS